MAEVDHVITTITNDSVKSRTIECMELARFKCYNEHKIFYWNVMYGDGKARSRSISASRFLSSTTANYLVFIDSDILFKPEDVLRLFSDLESGYDLIAGIFAVRGGTQPSSHGYDKVFTLDGKIHEFEYLSTGFLGCTRKLLEKIRDDYPLEMMHPNDLKFWSFFEERQFAGREEEPIFLSEDYDFCEKARKVGFKVYIDSSIQLGHIGEYVYTMHDVVEHYNTKIKGKEALTPDMEIPRGFENQTVREEITRKVGSSSKGAPTPTKK